MNKLLFKSGDDWSFDLIEKVWEEIQIIGRDELKTTWYSPQIEVVTSDQMLDAYSTIGMPIFYKHWSFGKEYLKNEKYYKQGQMGLAYEMVINSNPCIGYLMEDNDMTMQTMVLAHAMVGHSSVFKNNYYFKSNTNADSIVDYLVFSKNFIRMCEEKYGEKNVEAVLDACHSLSDYGIDKYRRNKRTNVKNEEKIALQKFEQELKDYDPIWSKLISKKVEKDVEEIKFPKEPEENILYFLEKHSPLIPQWKRELIRISRKIAQYFSPQAQCLTGNHIVSTKNGLIRFRDLIKDDGYYPVDNISLLSINNNYEPVSHFYKKSKQSVIRITTSSGRTFTGTLEHPLMMFRNNLSKLIKLEEAKIGDQLIINSNSNIFANEYVKLINDNKISNQNLLSEEMGEMLSYILTNTYSDLTKTFTFVFKNKNLATKCETLLKNCFNVDTSIYKRDLDNYVIQIKSNLINFLKHNFQDSFEQKENFIPNNILKSPKSVVAAFIRGLIDNKSINRTSVSSWEILGFSNDRETFETLQTLLLGYGINSKIKINIEESSTSYSLKETISGKPTRYMLCFSINDSYSKKLFEQEIGTNDDSFKSDNSDNLLFLKITNKDLHDDIVSIEKISEPQDVYDVTIPSNHLFWVNGVVSHNTKTLNEGYASFTHYYIMNRLYEKGLIDEGTIFSFLKSHTSVLYQPNFDSKWFNGFNPYALGFAIFMDIKRMSENPTEEDKKYFPDLIGKSWQDNVNYAKDNFNDDSFIAQFLSPKVVRDFKIFHLGLPNASNKYYVENIHNEEGFYKLREILSKQYNRSSYIPDIRVTNVDVSGNRKLTLKHYPIKNIPLYPKSIDETLAHLAFLWEFPVELETIEPGYRDVFLKIHSNPGIFDLKEDDF